MANNQRTITSAPTPTHTTVYDSKPQPQVQHTPRAEYAFMGEYALIVGQRTGSGPVGGGVQ